MFMCASVRDDNEESELAAGKIVERLHRCCTLSCSLGILIGLRIESFRQRVLLPVQNRR